MNRILSRAFQAPLFRAALLLVLISGSATASDAQARSRKPAHKAFSPVVNPLASEFLPIANGPGVQVCEPTASPEAASLADFGSGCALWLQWALGFQPELARTPRWADTARAARELHVPRLRLTPAQAARLGPILGVTHAAVGQITGTAAHCALTYTLYALPANRAVGAPIRLAGSEEQIAARLPEAARALAAALGAGSAAIPPRVGTSPADLALLARYNLFTGPEEPEPDQRRADLLARQVPLAKMLALIHTSLAPVRAREEQAKQLLREAPGNFVVIGVIAAYMNSPSAGLSGEMDRVVAAANAPNNVTLAYWTASRRPTKEDLSPYERIARLAPGSALAWATLAKLYSNRSEALRRGRFWSDISEEDGRKLHYLYTRWQYAAERSTQIDPDFSEAWLELARACVFNDNFERANGAFWRSFALNKNDMDLYYWGLEMYQEKWGGDPRTLAKVARLAAEAEFPQFSNLYALGTELRSAGFTADAEALYARAIVQQRETVRRFPNDSTVHAALGYYLVEQNQKREGEAELNRALQLDPNSPNAHLYLARVYWYSKRVPQAVAEYRENLRVTGADNARLALAGALMETGSAGDLTEAERLLNEILKTTPTDYNANEYLGRLLIARKQYDAAFIVLEIAEKTRSDASGPHQDMARIYLAQSKLDAAKREADTVVQMSPKYYDGLLTAAEVYAAREEFIESTKLYRRAVDLYPAYAPGHFTLGKYYLKIGKKDEGRAELRRVFQLDASAELKRAAQELLDKSP